jgi:hypothetical protein
MQSFQYSQLSFRRRRDDCSTTSKPPTMVGCLSKVTKTLAEEAHENQQILRKYTDV